MQNQKALFSLDPEVHYLNCAYMSPIMKSVEQKGIEGLIRKRNPYHLAPEDFFTEVAEARNLFAEMINCRPSQIALIPSASYGLSAAISNIPAERGNHALTLDQEFPSDFFPLQRWCDKYDKELKSIRIDAPAGKQGEAWNKTILESINEDSAVLVMSSVHWMNGIRFDLQAIGEKCRANNCLLIVDGTQSFGALPIDVQECKIDALVCASYKCMMGPYSIGLAYMGEAFNEGIPLEESWMNRTNAMNFRDLTDYEEHYTEDAGRYNVGEFSNFILVPMLIEALKQLKEWRPDQVQAYCRALVQALLEYCEGIGVQLEKEENRSAHILGLQLPDSIDSEELLKRLKARKIIVSVRGSTIRVSPSVYNTPEDIQALIDTIESCRQ
ncbi:MAG: aminotransferase class V-fold PLP-dependent enzyme [Bacteroidia bacterium]|nr:aminotransferase class V-fold PLP-dependent enzyme [Bacteroidia bacterium]